jgi:pimeloyl-ACP methyl ester carboxylesterase
MNPRVNVLLAVFFLLVLVNASHRLATMHGTHYREEVRIGAMPASLTLPVAPPSDGLGGPVTLSPPAPLVIVQHGFSASRQAMGWITRGLARNGFAVLAADFRGHGQNPTPFNRGALGGDIAALIAYARTRAEIDTSRIALVGHSMGAGAVFDYALNHDDIDAVVPISGSGSRGDTERPRNVLLLFADGDPERIRRLDYATMARLTGFLPGLSPASFGDLATGTARRLIEVPGNDHVTILYSEATVANIVEWLRGTWSLPDTSFALSPQGELREGIIAILCGLFLVFPVAGFIAAAVLRVRVPPATARRGGVWMVALAAVIGGLALFAGVPLSFFPLAAGNQLLSFLLITGAVYAVWVGRGATEPPRAGAEHLRAAVLGVTIFGLVYAAMGMAVSRLLFDLTLSPQRLPWFVLAALALLPLGIGMEAALRPPGGMRSVYRSLAAKALLIAGIALAIHVFGTLPPVLGLMIPSLLIALPIVEAVAARLYMVSGSVVASGTFTALFLAWMPTAIFPIT